MSRHISPANKPINPLRNERGSTTRVLLLLLLLVVAAAGYLFYFTDYINPRKEAAKPVVAQTAPIKQPLPPRPGQQGEVKPSPAAPAPAPALSAVPAPAQPGQPPAPAPAPPKPEQVKTAAAEAPATTAPAAKPAPAPAAAKPAPAPPAVKPAPAAAKPVPAAKPAQKAEKPVAKKKGGAYRLLIGDYVPGSKSFDAVQAKLKKSCITPVRKSAVQTAEPMHRLYVAEFVDQDEAEAELAKIKKLTVDAFLVYDNGKYLLFGGSYLSPDKAASERKKLAGKGVTSTIRKAQVTVKVTRVTAGSYASSEDARKDAARLKKQGIQATVVKGK